MDDSAGTKGTPRKTTKKKQYPEAEEIIRRWENGRGNTTDRKITPEQVREFAEKPQRNAGKAVIESKTNNSQIRRTSDKDTASIRKTGGSAENAREQQRKAAERGAQEAKKYAERQKKYEKAFGGRR